MQYRILGKTGLKVSAVGFGGIPIQRIDAWGTRALMERLVEKGVNYIDTARGYTVSESYLGEALSGGLREKFILATKSMSRGYADMARDIGISLSNLRTDYIDLYQLHNIKSDADFELAFSAEGAVAAIQDAIRAGKVGHLGATAHSVDSFERLLSYPEIETIMFPYNIVESQGEALMERAAAQNVGGHCDEAAGGRQHHRRYAGHAVHPAKQDLYAGHPRNGHVGRDRAEHSCGGAGRPAYTGGAGRMRSHPRRAFGQFLPQVRILCAVYGGHRYPGYLHAGKLSQALRSGGLGQIALRVSDGKGGGLHRLR